MANKEAPKVREVAGKGRGETVHTHPAFGQFSICSSSYGGGGAVLYGSNIPHQHCLTIRISSSEMHRHLSYDSFYSGKDYIEIVMSHAQWARAVSAIGDGEGVPCTIQSIDGRQVPQIERPIDKHAQFKSELEETMGIALGYVQALEEKISASSLSAKRIGEMQSDLAGIKANITRNLSFVADQFTEHMDATVDAAKIELKAYLDRNGFTGSSMPLLENDTPDAPALPQVRRRPR